MLLRQRGAARALCSAAAPLSLAVFTWGGGVSGALGHGGEYNELCVRPALAFFTPPRLTRRLAATAARHGA